MLRCNPYSARSSSVISSNLLVCVNNTESQSPKRLKRGSRWGGFCASNSRRATVLTVSPLQTKGRKQSKMTHSHSYRLLGNNNNCLDLTCLCVCVLLLNVMSLSCTCSTCGTYYAFSFFIEIEVVKTIFFS